LAIDFGEAGTMNNCAGEDQKEFNRSTDQVQALVASVHDIAFGKVRPYDMQKTVKTLKLERFMGLMVLQTNASGTFQEDQLHIVHISLITSFGFPIFQSLGRKQYHKVTEIR
jgi:hypothetical protein